MDNKVILLTPQELKSLIERSVRNVLNEKENKEFEDKTFSINKTAKILNIHSSTLLKKIAAGYIKKTVDNRISGLEIKNYLQNKDAVSDGNIETA